MVWGGAITVWGGAIIVWGGAIMVWGGAITFYLPLSVADCASTVPDCRPLQCAFSAVYLHSCVCGGGGGGGLVCMGTGLSCMLVV